MAASANKTVTKRYQCELCKYKKEFRILALSFVNKDLREEDVHTICSYLKLPLQKPVQWTATKAVYPRPAAFWILDHTDDERGVTVIEEWTQRPNSLQEILTKVLSRVDLAKKHTELLGKKSM